MDGRNEKVVLLAEDEPMIRDFLQMVLRQAGYEVIPAADGAEALALARAWAGDIDLVLSDIVMPRMPGTTLVKTLEEERPGIHILLMTGHSTADLPDNLRLHLLHKPFLPKDLVARIASILQPVDGAWRQSVDGGSRRNGLTD